MVRANGRRRHGHCPNERPTDADILTHSLTTLTPRQIYDRPAPPAGDTFPPRRPERAMSQPRCSRPLASRANEARAAMAASPAMAGMRAGVAKSAGPAKSAKAARQHRPGKAGKGISPSTPATAGPQRHGWPQPIAIGNDWQGLVTFGKARQAKPGKIQRGPYRQVFDPETRDHRGARPAHVVVKLTCGLAWLNRASPSTQAAPADGPSRLRPRLPWR